MKIVPLWRGPERLQKERAAEELVQALPSQCRSWWSPAQLRTNALRAVDEEIARSQDGRRAATFARACPVPGAAAGLYRPHLLVGPDRLSCIAGIAFRNLRRAEPFVNLSFASRPFRNPPELVDVARFAMDWFGVFQPKQARLESFRYGSAPPRHAALELGKLTMAAPRSVILAADIVKRSHVVLRKVAASSVYDRYAAEHDAFIRDNPSLHDHVRREGLDDLQRSEDMSALYEVIIEGEWAGIVAAWRGHAGPIGGYDINEFFLVRSFRGKGFGATVQQMFARLLPGAADDALFGTIHPLNGAALRTARRLGRVPVAAQIWIAAGNRA